MTRKFPTDRQHVFGLVWAVGALGHGLRGFSQQQYTACSLGLSATSQQYFSLRTNQPPATSRNQPAVLFSQNKPAPAISHQPTEQADMPYSYHKFVGNNCLTHTFPDGRVSGSVSFRDRASALPSCICPRSCAVRLPSVVRGV
jgi:hypothetical protein